MINQFSIFVVTLSGAHISDLFFNHEHPHLDKLYDGESQADILQSEIDAAILADATEFHSEFLLDTTITPADLVKDFSSRI